MIFKAIREEISKEELMIRGESQVDIKTQIESMENPPFGRQWIEECYIKEIRPATLLEMTSTGHFITDDMEDLSEATITFHSAVKQWLFYLKRMPYPSDDLELIQVMIDQLQYNPSLSRIIYLVNGKVSDPQEFTINLSKISYFSEISRTVFSGGDFQNEMEFLTTYLNDFPESAELIEGILGTLETLEDVKKLPEIKRR